MPDKQDAPFFNDKPKMALGLRQNKNELYQVFKSYETYLALNGKLNQPLDLTSFLEWLRYN